jgi:hypothetical protein
MNQRNRVLELLFFAVLSIIFIVLFFVNKPYDKKPVQIIKTTVESQVNKYDAVSVQP